MTERSGTSQRGPVPRATGSRWVAALTGLVVLVAGVVSIAQWTLIPFAIDSRIESTSYQDSTTGHLRTLTLADGRSIVIGRELLERAGGSHALDGAAIRKASWERRIYVDDTPIPLPVTFDMWRTVAAVVFLIGFGWWLRGEALR